VKRSCRVARWFIFKPKIPFWLNFEGLWNIKWWCVLDHLENVMAIWYMYLLYDQLVIKWYVIWYIFPRFGTLCQEKCGNPEKLYVKRFLAVKSSSGRLGWSLMVIFSAWKKTVAMFPVLRSQQQKQIWNRYTFLPGLGSEPAIFRFRFIFKLHHIYR
jgi:hypothetical protein